MNIKSLTAAILTLLVLIGTPFAEIRQTSCLFQIETAFEHADENTLVIFDIDEVIFIPCDQILHTFFEEEARQLFEDIIRSKHDPAISDQLWSEMLISRKNKLVDPGLPRLLALLQNRKIPYIALTNAYNGSYGLIDKREDLRLKNLKDLGISFMPPKETHEITFKDLQSKIKKAIPGYKEGVLFTCGTDKGTVLKYYFNHIQYKPKKIIFIDDKRKNLNSVESFCNNTGIEFLGFEYTAVTHGPKQTLNEHRARLQFSVLEKEHKWLSDSEADERLNHP
jgi:hypothetical protein